MIKKEEAEFLAANTAVFSVIWSFRNHANILLWCAKINKNLHLQKFRLSICHVRFRAELLVHTGYVGYNIM